MGLFDALRGRKSTEEKQKSSYEPASAEIVNRLWQRLGNCPICGGDFSGHSSVLAATTILAPRLRNRIEKYLQAVERKMPAEILPFHEWDARGENAEAYAIRCHDGNIALAVVHSACLPPRFRNVIRCDSLGANRSRELEEAVPAERWQPIVGMEFERTEPGG